MKLVIGLGNPGAQYALNRHNIGFLLIDALAEHYAFKAPRRHGQGLLAEGTIGNTRAFLLKPLTYMNSSGQAAAEISHFFKISPDDIIVIHDELDLPFARIRFKKGGGHGGHNGLKSIDSAIGKDYNRVRIGIGHPGNREAVNSHVLGNFNKQELAELTLLVPEIVDAFPLLLAGETTAFIKAIHKTP